jgi:hypothetical protein
VYGPVIFHMLPASVHCTVVYAFHVNCNPLSPSAVAGMSTPALFKDECSDCLKLVVGLPTHFCKIKLIALWLVNVSPLRRTAYAGTPTQPGATAEHPLPPLYPFTTGAALVVIVAFQIVFIENKLFFLQNSDLLKGLWFRVIVCWSRSDTGWCCWRVRAAECVVIKVLLGFGCVSDFYVYVVKLLATLLWIVCYLYFLQR